MALTTTIVQPRFMKGFACLGPDCPDTCCKDWFVDVDPETVRLWRSHPDPEWRNRLVEGLGTTRTAKGEERAFVKFRSDGHCVFHNEDRLCDIQKHLGERAMPWVCRVFPRGREAERELVAKSGSLACVAVARAVVRDERALDEALEGPIERTLLGLAAPSTKPTFSLAEQWALRRAATRILSHRTWSWEARLVLLCLFAEEVAGLDLVRGRAGLVETPDRYLAALAVDEPSGIAASLAKGRDEVPLLLVPVLRAMIELSKKPFPGPIGWLMFVAAAVESFGIAKEEPEVVARRITSVERAWRPVLERALPWLWANLLASLLHQVRFPGERPKDVLDRMAQAFVAFAIWRLLVTARLAAGVADHEGAAAEVAWQLGRHLLHSRFLVERALEGLRRGGLSPARLALLAV